MHAVPAAYLQPAGLAAAPSGERVAVRLAAQAVPSALRKVWVELGRERAGLAQRVQELGRVHVHVLADAPAATPRSTMARREGARGGSLPRRVLRRKRGGRRRHGCAGRRRGLPATAPASRRASVSAVQVFTHVSLAADTSKSPVLVSARWFTCAFCRGQVRAFGRGDAAAHACMGVVARVDSPCC